jgi:hypothetical protein
VIVISSCIFIGRRRGIDGRLDANELRQFGHVNGESSNRAFNRNGILYRQILHADTNGSS